MNLFEELSLFTKSALVLGVALLTYGFLSQLIPIDFFWEAKTIGWLLFLAGLIGLLVHNMAKRKEAGKKVLWNKIGIGAISFILLVQTSMLVIMPNTKAYQTAKDHLLRSEHIKREVGEIKGFGFTPTGGIAVQNDSNGETGSANVELTIKGDKAFKSVTVHVFKDYGKDWEVVGIE
ncbi:hypothetical protein ACFSKU_08830 [Pontibacter silvestris]|uniref:DUF4199 domain-containing protein n=1 Tax=Pontibacter silvestris TaxID=2305183 RepID=A0ABW4WX84_9BACT|nr:hypothetical protein [Pontibacter silvestris]MCC9138938.1 hypothetical protein [Pontibacter silvestris]